MIDSEFYLHFTEGFEHEDPRFCVSQGKVELGNSGDFGLLVSVSPPLSGSRYTSYDQRIDFDRRQCNVGSNFPSDRVALPCSRVCADFPAP